jgi:uncharacterized membrane protein YkoI
MTDKLKNTLLIVMSVAALALGGAAIAGAAQGNGSSNSSNSPQAAARPAAGKPPQRSDEQLLTGDTATKVRQAALAKVPGGTIERVETDADGHAAYEAHMRKADGSRVTVYVNQSFEVVSVESGP